ncbi:MAG: ABC transporter substrate-binding protein [Pseudomonadota bacterium]|nr:ABC transporter substrate-binding protein [Pseudomonadota bacterium]
MFHLGRRVFMGGVAALALVGPLHAQDLTEIKVINAPTAFEPLWLAQEEGIFEKHGLKAEIIPGGPPDAMMPQLITGQAQFALTSGLAVMNASAKGLPVQLVVGNMMSQNGTVATAALIAPGDSEIDSVEDLAGKKIGITSLNNQPHLALLMSATDKGVDIDGLTFVELPPPAMVTANDKGTVDAIYALDPYMSAAIQSGYKKVEESVSLYMDGLPSVSFAAGSEYVAENPEIVEAFIAAMTEAEEFANANPERVRDIDRKYTKLDEEFIANRPLSTFVPQINADALQKVGDAMVEYGWLENPPDMDKLIAPQAPRTE